MKPSVLYKAHLVALYTALTDYEKKTIADYGVVSRHREKNLAMLRRIIQRHDPESVACGVLSKYFTENNIRQVVDALHEALRTYIRYHMPVGVVFWGRSWFSWGGQSTLARRLRRLMHSDDKDWTIAALRAQVVALTRERDALAADVQTLYREMADVKANMQVLSHCFAQLTANLASPQGRWPVLAASFSSDASFVSSASSSASSVSPVSSFSSASSVSSVSSVASASSVSVSQPARVTGTLGDVSLARFYAPSPQQGDASEDSDDAEEASEEAGDVTQQLRGRIQQLVTEIDDSKAVAHRLQQEKQEKIAKRQPVSSATALSHGRPFPLSVARACPSQPCHEMVSPIRERDAMDSRLVR